MIIVAIQSAQVILSGRNAHAEYSCSMCMISFDENLALDLPVPPFAVSVAMGAMM